MTLLIFGSEPISFGNVFTGCKLSPFVEETFIEFKSKLIKGFFISINVKGFKSLKPKAFIVKLYSIVSGSICIFFISSTWAESNI